VFHTRIEQAFAQDALAHHARRAKENHFHVKPAFLCGLSRLKYTG
jgi:hypothetical protein